MTAKDGHSNLKSGESSNSQLHAEVQKTSKLESQLCAELRVIMN